jgi:hypothetical protein
LAGVDGTEADIPAVTAAINQLFCALPWNERLEQALATLARLVEDMART